jgi:hypothetical protein
VYCHSKGDYLAFRFITSNFIRQKICRKVDIERFFDVSEDSVSRAYKKFVEKGKSGNNQGLFKAFLEEMGDEGKPV